TAQGLKMHGGTPEKSIREPDMTGLQKGLENLGKHLDNLTTFGQSVVVAFNKYAFDTPDEIETIKTFCDAHAIPFAVNEAFTDGGEGAVDLVNVVVETLEEAPSGDLQFTYADEDDIETILTMIDMQIYGARDVVLGEKALKMLKPIEGTL